MATVFVSTLGSYTYQHRKYKQGDEFEVTDRNEIARLAKVTGLEVDDEQLEKEKRSERKSSRRGAGLRVSGSQPVQV